MSRRHRAEQREVVPDPKYGSAVVAKFMNGVMYDGEKSIAESIVYGAFSLMQAKTKQDPLSLFKQALGNVMPSVEVRSRRVGGTTYQVPVEISENRRQALAIRWIILFARARKVSFEDIRKKDKVRDEDTKDKVKDCVFISKLCAELLDASNGRGNAVKKREDMHRMAEANRAFSHYRW